MLKPYSSKGIIEGMKRAGALFVHPVDPKDKKFYRPSTYEETVIIVSGSIRDIRKLCERSKKQPPPHAKAGRMLKPPVPINHYNLESTITEYAMKKFVELGNNNDRARVEPRVASVLKEAKTNKQQEGEERIAQSNASKDKKIAAKDEEKEAALMKLAREEIAMLKQSIAKKETELKGKDTEIAKISQDNAKKDEKLKGKDLDIARKDKQIAYMKSVVKQQRGQIRQLESMLDPVDLTGEDESAESPNKRARKGEDTPKSILALQHESIKEAVKVKEENVKDYVSFYNAKIDKLATAADGGVVKVKVAELKSLCLNFDEFQSATAMTNMS